MPRLEVQPRSDFTHGENGAVVNGYAVLSRRDIGGRYDPGGTLTEEVFETPFIQMRLLTEFFGFEVIRDDSLGGGVGFQISTDGSSFLSWDGAAWTEDLSRYSTPEEVEEFIGQIPVGYEPGMAIRMRLQPVGGESPRVGIIVVYYELLYNSTAYGFEEDLERSLKFALIERLKVPVRDLVLAEGTNSVTVPSEMQQILQVTEVYDTVVDPGLTTNLFGSLSGSTITLTSIVTAGTPLLVRGTGLPAVILSAEPEYIESSFPLIYIELLDLEEARFWRTHKIYEVNLTNLVARKRWHPARQRVMLQFRCAASRRKHATRIADAVKVAMQRDLQFRSLYTGQIFVTLGFTPLSGSDTISEGMFERVVSHEIEGWDYTDSTGYEELPLSQLVRAGYGSMTSRYGVIEIGS